MAKIYSHTSPVGEICMKGNIYTMDKCPICQGNFKRIKQGLLCPIHKTHPRRYYIQFYSRELHKYISIWSDSKGTPLSSYEIADRILTRMRAEVDAGTFDPSRYMSQKLKPLKLVNWSSSWLERRVCEAEKQLISPSYLKALKRYVQVFQAYFKDLDIRDIGTKQVSDFYLSLKGSPKCIQNYLGCLHKMLSDALDWGDIGKLPKFPKFDVPEADIHTIDLDQQDAIINSVPDPMDRAYLLFTARQMVRPSETRALNWEDLDFQHNRVVIRRHFSLNELRPTTKSKNIKRLPLDGDVKEALSKLPRHITSPFVFQKKGRHYSESYTRKLWSRITSAMGIKISLYQGTRHSSITEAVERVGYDDVQEFVGHANRAMTKRYGKMNVKRLERVLRPKLLRDELSEGIENVPREMN